MYDDVAAQLSLVRQQAARAYAAKDVSSYMSMYAKQLSYTHADGRICSYAQLADEVKSAVAQLHQLDSTSARKSLTVDGDQATEVVVQKVSWKIGVLLILRQHWCVDRIAQCEWLKTPEGWKLVNVKVLKANVTQVAGNERQRTPLYFEERHGDASTRANTIRPMHWSVRRYLSFSTVFYVSIGVIFFGNMTMGFNPEDPWALIASALFGTVFMVLCVFCLFMLFLDLISARLLGRMDWQRRKARMKGLAKSYRYVARRAHLRGMKVGALFFGLACLVFLCVKSLIALRLINPQG